MKKILIAGGLILIGTTLLVISGSKPASSGGVIATWYGPGFAGKKTSSGEIFDPNALTAAHPSLPFGTMLLVCDERCARVKVNDRGPFGDADLDLSEGAARATGLIDEGRKEVSVVTSPVVSATAPEIAELPKTGGPR